MTNKELRSKYKQERKHLHNRNELSDQIRNNLLEKFELKGKVVSVFVPIEKFFEINTWPLLESTEGNQTHFCVPRTIENREMSHILYEGKEQLKENDWGILEPEYGSVYAPEEFEIVLVPLLAFDQKGNRIGYGGGFYDRFLSKCRPDTLKVGLSYFPPEKDLIKTEDTDIRLDFCVTPDTIYEFK